MVVIKINTLNKCKHLNNNSSNYTSVISLCGALEILEDRLSSECSGLSLIVTHFFVSLLDGVLSI